MPPRRHIGRRLTVRQREILRTGGVFSTPEDRLAAVVAEFGSVDACKAAWLAVRGELLDECELLERPWAWWQFDAPKWEQEIPIPSGLKILIRPPSPLRRYPAMEGPYLLEQWGLLSEDEKLELKKWGTSSRPTTLFEDGDAS